MTGLIIGLLAMLHAENVRLVRARRRTAAVMRRLKRDRDSRVATLRATVEQTHLLGAALFAERLARRDAEEACVGLTEELDAYRDEAKREERAWLN